MSSSLFHCVLSWLSGILLLLVILCRLSPVAKYYIKNAVLTASLLLNSVIVLPYGLTFFKQFRRTALFSG